MFKAVTISASLRDWSQCAHHGLAEPSNHDWNVARRRSVASAYDERNGACHRTFARADRAGPAASTIPLTVLLLITLGYCSAAWSDEKQITDKERRPEAIQSLLRLRCAKCHGPLNPKAKLNLSSLRGAARGGENGSAIVAGHSDKSLLWQRVAAGEMPPDAPLSQDDQALLQSWIDSGAAGLPTGDLGPLLGADHWAFQPLQVIRPPLVLSVTGVRTGIDQIVQAHLQARGLSLGPDADARTLVRRVSIDLTGLPPTPDQIEQFVNDTSDGAYERMVDRYLASPRFGERWGKHWLDAAGYADSNGYFSADTDRPLAYRYRDYVIRSLNADKPFDQFVKEQLAGDEMARFKSGQPTTSDAVELLEATHFLRNGQDGTDIGVQEPEAFEIDRRAALEAAVQVTCSSLLGLTIQCARCHDHKFEPITQQEYYQFQAILFPAFNPQDWVNPKDRVIYAYLPGEKEQWEEKEKRLKQDQARLRSEYAAWVDANREPSELLLHETFENDTDWKSRWSNTAPGDDKPGGSVTLGGSAANAARVQDGNLQIIAGPGEAWLSTTMSLDWTPEVQGAWIQATFELVDNKVGGGPAERIGYAIAAHDYDDSSQLDGGNLLIDGNPSTATNVYRDYPGGDQKVIGVIGEQGYSVGRSYGVRVTNLGKDKFRLEHLIDGLPDGKSLNLKAADLPDGGFAFFFCCNRSYVVDDVRVERSLAASNEQPDVVALRKKLEERRKEYQQSRSKLESQHTAEPGRAIAWVTDKSAKPPQVPLLTRGLYHLRGENVEPAALKMLTDAGHEFRPQPQGENAATTGRRSAFAEWLMRPEGRPAALAARVHANRIWRQYFGRGIVATTDNLGLSGSSPSQPELLEFLAGEFVHGGWSQKALHRLIVTSTVYRQSSAPRSEGLAADPDNSLGWRWPLRRLDAEVIRDAMLASAGQLDLSLYGPYVPTRQTPVGEVVVDDKTPGARRRSVYLQQRRSQTLSLLRLFDAPSVATVCSSRPSSTVPLQSLTLLNSDFAIQCSQAFAERLLAEGDSPAESVRRAWLWAIGREPTSVEQSIAVDFLNAQREQYSGSDAFKNALADFCQMVLASNAFLYLE